VFPVLFGLRCVCRLVPQKEKPEGAASDVETDESANLLQVYRRNGWEGHRAAHRTRSYGFYGRFLRVNTRTVGALSGTLDGTACDGMYPS
jgi:hypothetical protein